MMNTPDADSQQPIADSEPETVRKLVVPTLPEAATEPNDPRSPKKTDRDAVVQTPSETETSQTETVRDLVVPTPPETDLEPDEPRSPKKGNRDI
jgi:hypothetical protein